MACNGLQLGKLPLLGTTWCKTTQNVPSHCPLLFPSPFMKAFLYALRPSWSHLGLESGMVFEGTTGLYERLYHFNSK